MAAVDFFYISAGLGVLFGGIAALSASGVLPALLVGAWKVLDAVWYRPLMRRQARRRRDRRDRTDTKDP